MGSRTAEKSVILLVEDGEDDILLTRQAFARARIANPLFVVTSGQEAISYFEGRGQFANRSEFPVPDLVLLDINMHNGDGFTVLRWVRAHKGLKTLRIVMLTTSDETEDIDKAYLLGANSYIVKPSTLENFSEIMGVAVRFWFEQNVAPCLFSDEPKGHQFDTSKQ
jgi:CheY-like chemotaxis protein